MKNKKLVQVVMLPTEKSKQIGSLVQRPSDGKLAIVNVLTQDDPQESVNQHLYFTSNDEIKEGEIGYVIFKSTWGKPITPKIVKVIGLHQRSEKHDLCYKVCATKSVADINGDSYATIPIYDCSGKIIASTDSSLYITSITETIGRVEGEIKLIPLIPELFIQAFVKAEGKIKEVYVEIGLKKNVSPEYHDATDINNFEIKRNEDNTVIWSLVEERKYTRDKVIKLMKFARESGDAELIDNENYLEESEFNKWIEENL